MSKFRAWGLRGERVVGYVPQGHYKTQTMLAGIRLSGPVAPFVFDGAIDSEVFRVWTERFLLSELQAGDIVIADNLASHKTPDARKMIETVGCRLIFLPPYSPDYNPIEAMWAKSKEYLRTAEARELNVLYQAIAEAFTKVSQSDCQGSFKHCGYG